VQVAQKAAQLSCVVVADVFDGGLACPGRVRAVPQPVNYCYEDTTTFPANKIGVSIF